MSEFAVMPLEDYKSICDCLREAGGSSVTYVSGDITDVIYTRLYDAHSAGKLDGYETGYGVGYDDGKNSVIPLERYANQIKLKSLNVFGKGEVVLNLDSATDLSYLCDVVNNAENSNTTVEHLTINCPNAVENIGYMLRNGYQSPDDKLKHLTLNVDTSKATNFNYFVVYARALVTIDGMPINLSGLTATIYNPFQMCKALKDVRFVANTIKKSINFADSLNLSAETIQSIIDGLADLTGQTTQIVSFHSTVMNKLTEEQTAQIFNKNWDIN